MAPVMDSARRAGEGVLLQPEGQSPILGLGRLHLRHSQQRIRPAGDTDLGEWHTRCHIRVVDAAAPWSLRPEQDRAYRALCQRQARSQGRGHFRWPSHTACYALQREAPSNWPAAAPRSGHQWGRASQPAPTTCKINSCHPQDPPPQVRHPRSFRPQGSGLGQPPHQGLDAEMSEGLHPETRPLYTPHSVQRPRESGPPPGATQGPAGRAGAHIRGPASRPRPLQDRLVETGLQLRGLLCPCLPGLGTRCPDTPPGPGCQWAPWGPMESTTAHQNRLEPAPGGCLSSAAPGPGLIWN